MSAKLFRTDWTSPASANSAEGAGGCAVLSAAISFFSPSTCSWSRPKAPVSMTAHPAMTAASTPTRGITTNLRATLFTSLQDEMRAAVPLPRPFVMARVQRSFLAEADRGEIPLRNAEGNEVVHHGHGAPLAQRQVVLGGAALVAMPLDQQLRAGVLLQVGGHDLARLPSVLPHHRLVEVEPHVVELRRDLLGDRDSGLGQRGGHRRRGNGRGLFHGGFLYFASPRRGCRTAVGLHRLFLGAPADHD